MSDREPVLRTLEDGRVVEWRSGAWRVATTTAEELSADELRTAMKRGARAEFLMHQGFPAETALQQAIREIPGVQVVPIVPEDWRDTALREVVTLARAVDLGEPDDVVSFRDTILRQWGHLYPEEP